MFTVSSAVAGLFVAVPGIVCCTVDSWIVYTVSSAVVDFIRGSSRHRLFELRLIQSIYAALTWFCLVLNEHHAGNKIGDVGAVALSKSLRGCLQLETLDLRCSWDNLGMELYGTGVSMRCSIDTRFQPFPNPAISHTCTSLPISHLDDTLGIISCV